MLMLIVFPIIVLTLILWPSIIICYPSKSMLLNGLRGPSVMWVQNGDHNSSFFFHNCVCIHKHYNSISHITDSNGHSFIDRPSIEQVVLNFYFGLWFESSYNNFLDILNARLNDLHTISASDFDFLTHVVTKNEIYQTLLSHPYGRIPGPDDLHVEFYHFFFWNEIRDHLHLVV